MDGVVAYICSMRRGRTLANCQLALLIPAPWLWGQSLLLASPTVVQGGRHSAGNQWSV